MKKQKKGRTESSSARRASQQRIRVHADPSALPVTMAARCQELYVTARTTDSAGRIQLDRERLAHALAEAGIGVLAEQALYSLALMSAADGHVTLFEADVIAALERTTPFAAQAKEAH